MAGHEAFTPIENTLDRATWQHKPVQDVPKYSVRLMCQELRSYVRANGPVMSLSPGVTPLLKTIHRLTEHIDRLLDEGDKVARAGEGVLLWAAAPYDQVVQEYHRKELAEAVHEWRNGEREE